MENHSQSEGGSVVVNMDSNRADDVNDRRVEEKQYFSHSTPLARLLEKSGYSLIGPGSVWNEQEFFNVFYFLCMTRVERYNEKEELYFDCSESSYFECFEKNTINYKEMRTAVKKYLTPIIVMIDPSDIRGLLSNFKRLQI